MSAVPAAEARQEARDILAEGRFRESELPRPLERPLAWIGDRLESVFGGLDVPGGPAVGWLLLSALVLGLGLAVGLLLVRSRAPSAVARPGRTGGTDAVDPAQLEREADAAEQSGELERALRLRFRAGVLRLAARRLVDDPDGVTSGALVRLLRSPEFVPAVVAFDEVVYGRRAPTTEDARLAREGWRAALAGLRR
jgi:hypothetical protein